MVEIKLDSELCIGCGLCIGTHPEVFEFDDEGKAHVIGAAPEADADDAIANCPVGAISR